MGVIEKMSEAMEFVRSNNIDIDAAVQAYQSMHPDIDVVRARLAIVIEVARLMGLRGPLNEMSVARELADTSGAFPWDGPVGNGLSLELYRGRFLEMARETLFVGELLGLVHGETDE